MGTRVGVGKAAVNLLDVAISQDLTAGIVNTEEFLPEFLVLHLQTERCQSFFETSKRGATIKGVPREDLYQLEVLAPPLAEQRAIARVLTSIQTAVGAQQEAVAKLKELKAATMAKLFRESLHGEPLKQTQIGEIPESWELVPLEQVARIERGKFTHRPRNDPRFFDGPFPFVQTGDVAQANGRIRMFSQTLNEAGLAVSRMFPAGTILLTIAANIADTGILEFDSAFPDSMVGITPDSTVDVHFLEFYLRTQKQAMDRLAPKGTQKNINIQFLRPWPVPRPPMAVQREIALSLTRLDQRAEASMDRGRILSLLFSATLHLLMSGQLRLSARE